MTSDATLCRSDGLALSIVPSMDRTIWCLWEPEGTLPGYLRACLRSIERNSGVDVRLLSAKDVKELAPRMDERLAESIPSIANRSDYFRSHLLFAQGGMWLDLDVVVLRNLSFLFEAAEKGSLVARRSSSGHLSANLLCSVPSTPLLERWIELQEATINGSVPGRRLAWNALGGTSLTSAAESAAVREVDAHLIAPLGWRDSHLLTSKYARPERLLADDPATVMMYNSRFPDWVRRADERVIMHSPMLMSRLLRIALGETTVAQERRTLDVPGAVLERLGRGGRRVASRMKRKVRAVPNSGGGE